MTNEDLYDAVVFLLKHNHMKFRSNRGPGEQTAAQKLLDRIENGECPRCKGHGTRDLHVALPGVVWTDLSQDEFDEARKCQRCKGTGKEPT